ncbi:hypothetical protein LIPSTDRAFT_221414 [Lipomyces starkeyi NRRL Y-11557]|uniref:Uncharacterized protein n=1 Tax=Lipomyces starkeyi NRRL Y-11557 TaxID=675824 RepID=A0A1E3QFW1_LIPST|nr:hypothetical protein LIPSTDRAFT_221414 [Lipomyces starkeyi NRRL Y-11557]
MLVRIGRSEDTDSDSDKSADDEDAASKRDTARRDWDCWCWLDRETAELDRNGDGLRDRSVARAVTGEGSSESSGVLEESVTLRTDDAIARNFGT